MAFRRSIAAGICILIAILAGCAGPKYGSAGRTIPVRLESDPSDAQVYLVPLTEWYGLGGEATLKTPEVLEPYRRGDMITPTDAELPPKKLAYVAIKQDAATGRTLSQFKPITPANGAVYKLQLKAR